MSKTKSPPTFSVGDAVRVKFGVTAPDFQDIPFGGWAGTISEVEDVDSRTYLIALNERTLKSVHPIYHKRCERDGLESDHIWLLEEDLEPDSGEPVQISSQVEREIREVLGLRVEVQVVPHGTLPRFELKSRRFTDHRKD